MVNNLSPGNFRGRSLESIIGWWIGFFRNVEHIFQQTVTLDEINCGFILNL